MPETGPSSSSATGQTPATPPEPSRGLIARITRYRLLWILALSVYAADQLSKLWVTNTFPRMPTYYLSEGAKEVIPGFFHLVHVGNTGAAWSMFSGQGLILASLACATLIAIFFWRRALGLHDRFSQVSFGLLCGGIVGNLTDRVRFGYVIDFIDLHFGSYVYPTFNIADSGICVGVILYLWQSLRAPKPAEPKTEAPNP